MSGVLARIGLALCVAGGATYFAVWFSAGFSIAWAALRP